MVWFAFIRWLVAASLLRCRCGAEDPAPQNTGGHNISTRKVDSPQKCSSDSDCGDSDLFFCDAEAALCVCKDTELVLSSIGKCLPVKQLGEACEEDVQCQFLDRNVTCQEKVCICYSEFFKLHTVNETLCNKTFVASEEPVALLETHVIIVVAVLIFMFLGICVALRLFSKGRIWTRRTIFNLPLPHLRHIKLNKRKMSSVSTQDLPPDAMPHHQSSSRAQSPTVPKTRSHECLQSGKNSPSSPNLEIRPSHEKHSSPFKEDLEKNDVTSSLNKEESQQKAPGTPTIIVADPDEVHNVATNTTPPPS